MENKNPLVRLVTYGKIKKMMKQFKDCSIDDLERNMMRGMFRRKLKDFAELQKHGKMTLFEQLKMQNMDTDENDDGTAKH